MNTQKQGARAMDDDSDALSLALSQMSVPDCPEIHKSFIDETSLERLVYWKIQFMFQRFEDLPIRGIMEAILTNVERPLFAIVLRKTKGNQSKTAEILGCNRNTVHRKLKNFLVQPTLLRRAMAESKPNHAIVGSDSELNFDFANEHSKDGY